MTKIIKINEKNLNGTAELEKLQKAANIIKNGGLVAFPTETVYGLGANALDRLAVLKIYEAKGRPADNPLIVHLAFPEDIYKYAKVPPNAAVIIERFLPAPLTLVLKKKDETLRAASPDLETVALRVPAGGTARKLIELSGVPIAAPSANLSGKPSPTDPKDVIDALEGRADMIICGENCEIGLESTVISFNDDNSLNILRSGYITREMLAGFDICDNIKEPEKNPPAPGMKYSHYAPGAPLYILSGSDGAVIGFIKKETEKNEKTGFLCFDEFTGYFKGNKNIIMISMGRKDDQKEQAKNLFCALNRFDSTGAEIIYSVEPKKSGLGEAIYNRLFKAAGGKIIKV